MTPSMKGSRLSKLLNSFFFTRKGRRVAGLKRILFTLGALFPTQLFATFGEKVHEVVHDPWKLGTIAGTLAAVGGIMSRENASRGCRAFGGFLFALSVVSLVVGLYHGMLSGLIGWMIGTAISVMSTGEAFKKE